jgi:hypothetical protein
VFSDELYKREQAIRELRRPSEDDEERVWANFDPDGLALKYDEANYGFKIERGHFWSVTQLLKRLSSFPRLRTFSVVFCNVQSWDDMVTESPYELQDTENRLGILYDVFQSLEHVPNLKTMELYNLENIESETLLALPAISVVLRRLRSLRICLQETFAAPRETYANFPETWLGPSAATLTKLSLFLQNPFECQALPFEITKFHLPLLEVLEMGYWRMTKKADLDWLASHKFTLKKLRFATWLLQFDDREQDPRAPTFSWATVYSELRTFPKIIEFINTGTKTIGYNHGKQWEDFQLFNTCPELHSKFSKELDEFLSADFSYENLRMERDLILQYEVRRHGTALEEHQLGEFVKGVGDAVRRIPDVEKDILEYDLFIKTVEERKRGRILPG